MRNTKTKEYKAKIFNYILDCIDSEDIELKTPKEKIDHFFERFESEFNYKNNRLRHPNFQDRIANYLMGLPFNFEFENYKILQLAEELHNCKLTEKEEDKIIEKYWSHLAFKIIQLKKHIDNNYFEKSQ